ncbi:MAG: phosphoenolpyruvate-protein phosphotransferase [Thiocapsa sp.]|jgi:phosphoenolpyruvate-protein kinase (PTS system EI component)|nr:putative PEP-binding protein [Thiocapsa sp.]MCG6986429.1 phosphoenolpyruvate-protein phosphotransferase [Thiocapsa sp.]
MTRLRATPYAPGHARGILRSGSGDGIRLVRQPEVCGLSRAEEGLIVIEGAPFSHDMIRLIGLGIPVVMVSQAQADRLPIGGDIWIDGTSGLIRCPPPSHPEAPPREPLQKPVCTADGQPLELRASVHDTEGARSARANGAGSIGLVHSEYLNPADGSCPDVDFYAETFAELCDAARPLEVTLRLLDIAPTKCPPWLHPRLVPVSPIGLQGARLYREPSVRRVVEAQLAAVDRLADRYPLRLLVPYLTAPGEMIQWRSEIQSRLSRPIPVGAMVETPALALDLARLLDSADFVAIGLNDLMQCLFAADRDQPALSGYLDPHAPVLYRFLHDVALSAGVRLSDIQLCGILPWLPGILPILLGLGFRVFSLDPHLLPELARRARAVRLTEARDLAARVRRAGDSAAVRAMLFA